MSENLLQHELDATGRLALAEALGDTPETVIAAHQLRRGLCRAWVAGSLPGFDAAVVQGWSAAEPMGFGADPVAMWDILRTLDDWDCICVPRPCAAELGRLMERDMGVAVRTCDDIFHTLTRPVIDFPHVDVRLLTLDDLALLESAPEDLRVDDFGGPRALLTDGFIACAIVEGKLVASSFTFAVTPLHADLGVFTLRDFRGRGFARSCASLVAGCVQKSGRTPVWSTGPDNLASLRVAHRLGFSEVSRRTYVIPGKES